MKKILAPNEIKEETIGSQFNKNFDVAILELLKIRIICKPHGSSGTNFDNISVFHHFKVFFFFLPIAVNHIQILFNLRSN